jgi:hypothetical protein
MSLFRPLCLALAAGLALAACATPPQETTPPDDADAGAPQFAEAPPPPAMDAPAAPEEPAMTCDPAPGQWAVGQIADEALVAKVRADTHSDRVRVIRPGMAVTMDWREDRLNLEVDADNRVLTVRCG